MICYCRLIKLFLSLEGYSLMSHFLKMDLSTFLTSKCIQRTIFYVFRGGPLGDTTFNSLYRPGFGVTLNKTGLERPYPRSPGEVFVTVLYKLTNSQYTNHATNSAMLQSTDHYANSIYSVYRFLSHEFGVIQLD